jgi:hypothetical protein
MNTTHFLARTVEVPGYVELQHEMHEALRAQHPEWIQPTAIHQYVIHEFRFAELLVSSLQFEAHMCTVVSSSYDLRRPARAFSRSSFLSAALAKTTSSNRLDQQIAQADASFEA